MSEFRTRIDLAINLAEILVDMSADTLSDEDADELFEDSFKFYKDLLKRYDSNTINQIKESATLIIELSL